MKDKKIKFYFTGKDYGYFVNLWDVPSDFTDFKKNFILLFKGSQQATAQINMEIIEWIIMHTPMAFMITLFMLFLMMINYITKSSE